jgi:hypothetical protein
MQSSGIKWRHLILPLAVFMIIGLHPFLSLNRPIDAKVLVIEGWLPEEALNYAANIFRNSRYELILTNGGNVKSKYSSMIDSTYADLSKNYLIQMGVDKEQIISIKTKKIRNSKTYNTALSTIDWLITNKKSIKAINVVSLGPHARKSYILYKKAAKGEINVGIISIPPVDYHPFLWCLSLYGIQFVIKNLIGFLYALTV